MTMPLSHHSQSDAQDLSELNQRLQGITWALFLIMTGLLWLLPHWMTPDGLWWLFTGFLLLGLNGIRALNDIETSGFTVVLGLLALTAGMSGLMGVGLPIVPILLIAGGALMIGRSWGRQV